MSCSLNSLKAVIQGVVQGSLRDTTCRSLDNGSHDQSFSKMWDSFRCLRFPGKRNSYSSSGYMRCSARSGCFLAFVFQRVVKGSGFRVYSLGFRV